MAELKEGQQIIFRHPSHGEIRVGVYSQRHHTVSYLTVYGESAEPEEHDIPSIAILEWCDAEAAFNAWGLQQVRAGNFEWAQPENGPTVEP